MTNQIFRKPDGTWYTLAESVVKDELSCKGCVFESIDTDCHNACGELPNNAEIICVPYNPSDDLAKIFEAFDQLDEFLVVPDYEDEFRSQIETAASRAAKARKMVEELGGRMG